MWPLLTSPAFVQAPPSISGADVTSSQTTTFSPLPSYPTPFPTLQLKKPINREDWASHCPAQKPSADPQRRAENKSLIRACRLPTPWGLSPSLAGSAADVHSPYSSLSTRRGRLLPSPTPCLEPFPHLQVLTEIPSVRLSPIALFKSAVPFNPPHFLPLPIFPLVPLSPSQY